MAPKIFDADARATARAKAGLKLGDKLYPRALRNNDVTRALRKLERQDDKLNVELERVSRIRERTSLESRITQANQADDFELGDHLQRELDQLVDEINEDRIDEINDQLEHSMFEKLAILLAAAEDGSTVTAEQVGQALDVEDASELVIELMRTGKADEERRVEQEDPADPTGGTSRS